VNPAVVMPAARPGGEEETRPIGPPCIWDQIRGSGSLGVVHGRLMKQKQYSSTPPEPSPGARKCSLSTMWLWPPAKGL